MSDVIVLLHGSANGAYSWGPVRALLGTSGQRVFAPDMLGYGQEPAPSETYDVAEEVRHLARLIDREGIDQFHLVTHSLGSMVGLHLRRAVSHRVTRMTLVDPLVVSVLREQGEDAGYAEMELQYGRFMSQLPDHVAAARLFVEHWNGPGSWDSIGNRARAVIASLVPKVRLEMMAARFDTTPLAVLAASPPPTTILTGANTLIAPRATARCLAQAFSATTLVVPDAGHMLPLTHPKAVALAIGASSH
jgi:pimeloyl-ACP methyl ester carboxylesterase